MEINEIKRAGDALQLNLAGRMDAITAADFTEQMETWIGSGVKNFTIACTQLDYISSSGLRAILTVAKKVRGMHGSLRLAAMQENIRTIFTISGFDKIIAIDDAPDDPISR